MGGAVFLKHGEMKLRFLPQICKKLTVINGLKGSPIHSDIHYLHHWQIKNKCSAGEGAVAL
jgi:hypothetical protein